MDQKPHLGIYDIATIVLYFSLILIVGIVVKKGFLHNSVHISVCTYHFSGCAKEK